MPDGAVYVGRPTRFGNPYRISAHRSRAAVLLQYESHIMREIASGRLDLSELRGRPLACWCRLDAPCHADILLRLANT
jgi:hypothetical protein